MLFVVAVVVAAVVLFLLVSIYGVLNYACILDPIYNVVFIF